MDVLEEEIVVTRYLEGGAIERRLASPDDVAALFASATAGKVAWWQTGGGVAAVGLDADGCQRWLVLRPPAKAAIRVRIGNAVRRATVHCPALLGELVGRPGDRGVDWQRVNRVFAVGDGPLTPASSLHAPPFANVRNGGRTSMCNVEMKLTAGQQPAEAFDNAFFGSEFTGAGLDYCLSPAGKKRFRNAWDMYARGGGRIRLAWLKKEGTYGEAFGIR